MADENCNLLYRDLATKEACLGIGIGITKSNMGPAGRACRDLILRMRASHSWRYGSSRQQSCQRSVSHPHCLVQLTARQQLSEETEASTIRTSWLSSEENVGPR